jgi:PQQ-dependent dehydrogenase (s-GDH family)
MPPITTTTARTGTLLFAFILLSTISFAQFDNCANPTSLTPNTTCVTTQASLFNATSSGIAGSCAGTKYDVWFTFSTPAGCTSVNIDVADVAAGGSNIDATNTFIEAFSGLNCSTTPIGSCTPMGTTLTLTGLNPSTNYHLRVFTTTNPTAGNSGKWDFDICITYIPPPANDDCSNATSLTSATSCSNTTSTLVGTSASTGLPAGCESAGVHYDSWYKFVATTTTHTVTISGQGSNFTNPEIQLYSGTCGTLASITCGTTTLTYSALSIGVTYYVRVSNIGSSPVNNGGFSICVTNPPPPPSNDDCVGATTLTSATSCSNVAGTIEYSTATGGLPASCETVGTHYDVWYKFVASNATHIVTISGQGSNFTNPEIQLYSGTCGTLASITCGTTTLTYSALSIGATYYVRVSNIGSSPTINGDFNICVTHPTPPPSNDDCAGAATLTSATNCSNTSGTLVSATATTGLPVGCETGGTHYDVWYKFVASNTTHAVTISGQGTSFTNAQVQLYSGACGSLTSIACGNTSLSSTTLTVLNTYYIRVSNVGSNILSNGGFNICVTHPPASVNVVGGRMKEVYKQTTLSGSGVLQYPWEVTYGPDNNLWITESRGYKVYKMDPNTGAKTTVLDISMGSTWLPSPADTLNVQFNSNWPQGGLAGLAIHPNFLDGTGNNDYVYISYVHRNLGGSSPTGLLFRNKLVRFKYNSGTGKLESPAIVCDNLPGSNDHNSQRIIIAPVAIGGTPFLFYASGDMGAGQFSNRTRPNRAQDPASYEGKILRFNLDVDGDAGANAWIPNDNPYSATSAVWSIGIRNNQGFAYDPALNILYGSSHGPYSDDEINIFQPFKNYGHPLIEGFVDGNYNGNSVQGTITSVSAGAAYTDNLGVSSCPPIGNEATNKATIDASGNGLYKDPLFSAYAVSQAIVTNIWQTNPGNATPAPGWPTEAWSGLDIYRNTLIPGWKNSLVNGSLKWGRLLRMRLDATGAATAPTNTVSDTVSYFNSQNRFRDLAFSSNGKDVFVIMDNTSTTSGPGSANPVVPACAGCVQKYTFLGYYDVAGKSSIPTSIDVTNAAVNTCNTGTTVTIDNTNNNLWVPITGPDGNIMAEIYANGNNLGTVTSSFYKNSGPIRVASSTHYLDRNMTITPENQPTSTVKIRLYLSKAELDALIADGASNVSAIGNLKIYKNNDPCSSAISTPPTGITPTYAEAHGANGYMLQGDITSFSSFYFAAVNSFTLFTLPLDLLSFTGQLQNNNSVLLNWKTENEINTSHFVVERSVDGIRFNAIGNVTANGRNNTGGSFNYALTDNDAINQSSQRIYYRLKMVDIDGRFEYSNIISVSFPLITGKLSIAPNPVLTEMKVTIASEADGRVQWKLTDNVGRVIQKGAENVRKGVVNNFTINMNRLPAGTYNLNVTGAGINQNEKIQKM